MKSYRVAQLTNEDLMEVIRKSADRATGQNCILVMYQQYGESNELAKAKVACK